MDFAAFTLVFIPLLVVVNPPASLALFLTLGKDLDRSELRTIARRACAFAAVVLMGFLVGGEDLLHHLGIELYSLRVAGGLMLGIAGINMLKEGQKLSKKQFSLDSGDEISTDEMIDFGLVPIGMPMLAGPGSISLIILLGTTNSASLVAWAILLVMLVSMLIFYAVSSMQHAIGENSTRVITRVMGLLTVTIAVQYFFDGLEGWYLAL